MLSETLVPSYQRMWCCNPGDECNLQGRDNLQLWVFLFTPKFVYE